MRYFARRYRCIAFNARGWPPSEVPQDAARYSQARARDDIRCVLDALKIDKAHVVGLSMGGFATLHFGLTYPKRALSLLVAGAGYGSERSEREKFRNEATRIAGKLEKDGHGRVRRRPMPTGPRACSSRTRIRAALPSSRPCWPSTRPRAPPTPSSACSASVRRSSTWRTSSPSSTCPCWSSPATRTGLACCRASSSSALPVRGPAGRPQQRPHHQHRGARGLQCGAGRFPRPGRRRPLAHARSPGRQPEHHRHDEVALVQPRLAGLIDNDVRAAMTPDPEGRSTSTLPSRLLKSTRSANACEAI